MKNVVDVIDFYVYCVVEKNRRKIILHDIIVKIAARMKIVFFSKLLNSLDFIFVNIYNHSYWNLFLNDKEKKKEITENDPIFMLIEFKRIVEVHNCSCLVILEYSNQQLCLLRQ